MPICVLLPTFDGDMLPAISVPAGMLLSAIRSA